MAATGPVQTDYISLFALRSALRLEARGMRVSRGRSALAIAKDRLDVKGSRETVMQALDVAIARHPGNPKNQ